MFLCVRRDDVVGATSPTTYKKSDGSVDGESDSLANSSTFGPYCWLFYNMNKNVDFIKHWD